MLVAILGFLGVMLLLLWWKPKGGAPRGKGRG
jgi:hypothetical protein